MFIPVTYESLIQRYPDAVREVRAKQLRGRSRHKDLPGEELAWGFSFAIRIEGLSSFADVLASMGAPTPAPVVPGPEELERRVADLCRRTVVSVLGGKGRAGWYGSLPAGEVPDEIGAWHRGNVQLDLEREARWARLSPSARDRESGEALQELLGTPGFVAFGLPHRPIR